jgi:egghead protein (zeste-white 4 protein)
MATRAGGVRLRAWLYRGWLCAATAALCAALLWLQGLLGAVPAQPSRWQMGVQWAEIIWLAPVPSAAALWLGWLLFAEMALPDPTPISAPRLRAVEGASAARVHLVFRFVTRGDNAAVLATSVAAVHRAFAGYARRTGPYRVEVVSERPVGLDDDERTRVYVVPPDYAAPGGSRYKARALTYLQGRVRLRASDWCVYLDEESTIDGALLAGLYRFVGQGGRRGRIGQGAIVYDGGSWFFGGADALRTADDLGRFRLQYALGMPLFGVHGSFIVVRGADDAALSFDVGAANSLTEDVAWSLRAWARGYRFAWVPGYLHEQPPQRAADFVRQRARWLTGIRRAVVDRAVPLRYRLCLGAFTALWQLSFLPFLVAVAALFAHVAPFAWMRLPADFAWATYVLAYLQGADCRAARRRHDQADRLPASTPSWLRRAWPAALRGASWALALCYLWYALLEAAGVLWSLVPSRGFFVIRKPDLARRLVGPTAPVRTPALVSSRGPER